MTTRRVLIYTPLVLGLFLLQSYFWVPTYDEQARGNPHRLGEYINGSIGDATVLNPILSADSASSEIEGKVFEGLIDRDEDLRFRGRVASGWRIYEQAFFYINAAHPIPGHGALAPQQTLALLQAARRRPSPQNASADADLGHVRDIVLLPPQNLRIDKSIPGSTPGESVAHQIEIKAPARIKLVLDRVDQDLFKRLARILGTDYFNAFKTDGLMAVTPAVDDATRVALSTELLPPTEHNPIIEFQLRSGVRFHDDHELDAQDVKFTYDAIMNPKNLSPRVADYEPVKQVEVLDRHRVRIIYKRLYSPALGTWAMGILPQHLLNDDALAAEARRQGADASSFSMRQSGFSRHPIGCGPFRFQRWKSDQYIVLDRFDDYWEGAPNYKRYVFRVIPNLLTQEMEFYAGTIDSYEVQPHQVRRLEDDPRFQRFSGTSFGYSYIGYNMRRAPFDDRRVRRALGMAIDVEKIIRYVLHGQGEEMTGPFVKQTEFYNHSLKPLAYDPAGALKLLAEAGWRRNAQGWLEKEGRKLQFTLITNSGNDIRKAILAIAQDAWKQIGVDVRTDLIEWSVFIQERVNKADFDALILGWSMGIDPDLYQIWHSSQAGPHQLNFVNFNNPEADDLIVRIRQEYDHAAQVADCHRLHEIIAFEQPYTFLFVGKWTAVLDKRIVIQDVDAAGNTIYRRITPTKTGNYMFYFNQWVKLAQMPELTP